MLDPVDEPTSGGKPPLLLVGPAGGGKTAACLKKVAEVQGANPLARTWVLVATQEQRVAFRRRLLNETGLVRAVSFGVDIVLFSGLCERIVDSIGIPPRRLSRHARPYLLRKALDIVAGEAPLEHYSSIVRTRGFADATLALISELQRNGIPADAFAGAATSARERDLGRIYAAYEALLRSRSLCDDSNLWQLAAEALDRYAALGTRVDLLVVDGFSRLHPTQLALLARLAARARETVFTLTYSDGRALDAHRSFAATFGYLRDQIGCAVRPVDAPPPSARAVPLAHLEAHLFALGEQRQASADGGVVVLEAPDAVREVQEVGRRVKRLLLSGVAPSDVVVLARSLSNYGPLCREVFQGFGIPAVVGGLPLAANPVVAALSGLLTLADDRFPRARVVELLRSPYLRSAVLRPDQVEILDRVSRERVVVRGREQWLQALVRRQGNDGSVGEGEGASEDEADLPPSALGDLSAEQVQSLRDAVADFFDRVTPPAQGTVRDYVRWVEGLVGPDPEEQRLRAEEEEPQPESGDGFDVVVQARSGPDEMVARDVEALCVLKGVLGGILAGSELAEPSGVNPWPEFHQDLLAGIGREKYDPDSMPAGRVLVAVAESQRGVPREHVFLLGMAEGNFPHRLPDDPLLWRSDRQALATCGVELDPVGESDEMSLFYEVAALARKTLILSRPYLDDSGNPWPASPYIRAVTQVLSGVEVVRRGLSYLPAPGESASLIELCLYAGSRWSPKGIPDGALVGWLVERPETASTWTASSRARGIEWSRELRAEKGPYAGIFAGERVRGMVAELLGERRLWSVTQFNEYAQCPFKFFANRLLKLELVEEPVEGFNQLHLGVINHRVLELTYRRIMESGIGLTREALPEIERIFDEVADKELASAPVTVGFRPTGWWQHERTDIRKRLWRLIENDVAEGSGVQLFKQEVRFDFRGADGPVLVMEGPAGRLKVRGQIDRIDRIGGGYRVIDYKSGGAKIKAEDQAEGRNTQMQVYLLAAAALLRHWGEPDGKIEGFFRHIRSGERSGELVLGDDRVEQTRQRIHQNVLEGRRGNFPVQPSKIEEGKCAGYCDFGNLCRFW